MLKPSLMIGRLLCWLSFHDFRIIDRTLGFGAGGGVKKVVCQRCGVVVTRSVQDD